MLRFAALGGVGELFSIIGLLFITVLTTLIAYGIIINSEIQYELSSIYPSLLVVFVISLAIALPFLQVYSGSMSAILHAFLLDEHMNEE